MVTDATWSRHVAALYKYERIYMLGGGSAPHSPSGGAAMLHPIGAQPIPTVQENAKSAVGPKPKTGFGTYGAQEYKYKREWRTRRAHPA